MINLAGYQKSIIVETQMALTLDDADAMIEACDLKQLPPVRGQQNRFNVPVVKLRMKR